MDEPMKHGARLEVSVSFGRFENDALSWEKWSSFSPNKYLEEAGTLSTPGSVAQKKAYFEAHYKKIAARKAELEQEKMRESVISSSAVSSKEDCVADSSSELDNKFGSSNDEGSTEEVANGFCATNLANGPVFDEAEDDGSESPMRDEEVACMNGSIVATLEEERVDAPVVKCEKSAIEEAKDELNGNAEGLQLDVQKEDVIVEPVTPQKHSQHTVEKPSARKSGIQQPNAVKRGTSKLNARISAQKVTPTKKERNLAGGTKNKIVSPLVKSMQTSTPRNLKPAPMNTPVSAPKTFKKQVNGSPLPKSKNYPVGQSKSAGPTSLHMSLSLSSANSLAAVSMTRKSLIMEKMGDKDIVKRAFKAFQNRPNGSILGEKPSPTKHMSPTAFEPKISSRNLTKGNEGPRKVSVNEATQRSRSGSRSNHPNGLSKSSTMDSRNRTVFSPTSGLRSDEKAEKRKEFLKKLETRSIARELEKAQLSAKPKVHVGNEIHPQRPTLSR